MAGLLDMLLGAAAPSQAATNTTPTSAAAPTPDATAVPTTVSGVTVAAPRVAPVDNAPPSPSRAFGYDNMDEVNALRNVQSKYSQVGPAPDAPKTGLVSAIPDALPGAGTLRNLLGTLGDAFLVQSGHQPVYAQRLERQQIANASAGFDTDPSGAAVRIAATGAPGSMQEAQTMQNNAESEAIRKATMENTNAYRSSVLADRTQNHEAQQQLNQAKADDRTRSLNGGILAAAAATGDQGKYTAERAAALKRIGPSSTIDPSEYPEDLHDFNAGYGLNANQYQHNVTANNRVAQTGQIAQMRNATTMRGQDIGASNNDARVGATIRGQNTSMAGQMQALQQKQNSGQKLTPAEQQVWDRNTHIGGGGGHLNIPGLSTPSAGRLTPQQAAGLPSGTRFQGTNGQWYVKH